MTGDESPKERTRRLIQTGGLADVAGLGHVDSELLLGLLLQARDYLDGLSGHQINILRRQGGKRLEERRREKEPSARPMSAVIDEDFLL